MGPAALSWPALMDQARWQLQKMFYVSVSHGLNSVSWASQSFHLSVKSSWTSVSCSKQIKHYEQILWGAEKKPLIFVIISRHHQSSIATRPVPCLFLYWNYWGKLQSNKKPTFSFLPGTSCKVFVTAVFSLVFLLIKWCIVSCKDLTASYYNQPA